MPGSIRNAATTRFSDELDCLTNWRQAGGVDYADQAEDEGVGVLNTMLNFAVRTHVMTTRSYTFCPLSRLCQGRGSSHTSVHELRGGVDASNFMPIRSHHNEPGVCR